MATISQRIISLTFSGDIQGSETIPASANVSAPGGYIASVDLSSGANTISLPSNARAATIIPPPGNSTSITLKGISGDTGIRLHNTDPTSIGLDSSVTSFVLTTGGSISGVKICWS